MIEASQFTTGVTPDALGVQYAAEMGIVNTCVLLLSGVCVPLARLAADTGEIKMIFTVFSRLLAFRKTSCRTPPAAMVGGYRPEKLTGFVVAFTSVIVATAKWVGSEDEETTTNTVVGTIDLLPAGFVSVGTVVGAVKTPLLSMVPHVGSQESDNGFGD